VITFVFIATTEARLFKKLTAMRQRRGSIRFLTPSSTDHRTPTMGINFINNQNLTLLVTRRTYTNPSNFTDAVVALLSWTGRNKAVVYIGWAAVSGGQSNLPSPLADSTSLAYGLPVVPAIPQPVPKGFTRLRSL
jgi:hypothetical protein